MSQFQPREEYHIKSEVTRLRDFFDYTEDYVVRPPYQRHTVWSTRKKQALWDSLLRRYYIPRIILREVRLDGETRKLEVVDGQQRINSVVEFFQNRIRLPKSVGDLRLDLARKTYDKLPVELRRYVDTLKFDVDLVIGIDDPHNPDHQKIAAEIFWRLQQGETLTYMEVAHARLSSLPRNFIAKYADDITFDFEAYRPIDENPKKHRLFSIIHRKNDRMQHLALLARLTLLERNDGPADIRDKEIARFIDEGQVPDGIGNESFEDDPAARAALRVMNEFVRVYELDPVVAKGETSMKELSVEYFIISLYLLLRHLMAHYVFRDQEREWFRRFTLDFHARWRRRSDSDTNVLIFSDNRQHSTGDIELRHQILRQVFFEWLAENGHSITAKDTKRAFSESERIAIYRRDRGLCQACIEEDKPEEEAVIPWREFDADHVLPHAKGGSTVIENGRVLCRPHNRQAGAAVARS